MYNNLIRFPLKKKVYVTIHQQNATYLIPSYPDRLKDRLNCQQSAKITKSDVDKMQLLYGDRRRECIDDLRRKKYARFGSLSGVDPSSLFPTKKFVEEEREAEARWWPTLQQMQKEITEDNARKESIRQEREKKIAENMAKMPEWIAKFKAEQKEVSEKIREEEEKKKIEVEQVQEKFGFPIPSNSRLFIEYLTGRREKERKEKKKMKKLGLL